MEEALDLSQAKDTKERMAGVERLQALLEQGKRSLTATEVGGLVDASLGLLKDNNFRVCQGALQALALAAALSSEHLKMHFNVLLPAVVERLGDGKQPVRDAGRRLLLALMETSSPTIIVERAGSYAWTHKNWRVREEFARMVASAINLFAAKELPFQHVLLPSVLQLLEDSNSSAREAAMVCLEEMYRQGGAQLRDELQQHSLRASQLKEVIARFEKIEPKSQTIDSGPGQVGAADGKPAQYLSTVANRRNNLKMKPAVVDTNALGGESDAVEKPMEPIRVYSEKELTKELEKISAMLTPEQDWSIRIAAMQRVEGLVIGGATEYACFPLLLKQLVNPLSVQLSDRRSSIVKQACHLLNLLSKELLADFESCAEAFIPVLFKLVVITVLVIAESADTCIKTMLRNCRVARVLPRIVDNAKNDRNSVLRTRCCEYALLVLEQWLDSPEIQKLVELYEDLIKCCVGDAMSEVRLTARICYRVFARRWPERARRLFTSFDPVIQRLINEEDGGVHKRYASPSLRDRAALPARHQSSIPVGMQSASAGSQLVSFGTTPIVAMDKSATLLSTQKVSSERSLESVLQASQQQVNAIETMLKGMDSLEKGDLTSIRSNGKDQASGSYRRIHAPSAMALRVGIDPPSARDPPYPASTLSLNQAGLRSTLSGISPSYPRGAAFASMGNSVNLNASSDFVRGAFSSITAPRDIASSNLPMYSIKRVPTNSDKSSQGSSNDESNDVKVTKRVPRLEPQTDKHSMNMSIKETFHKDGSHSSIPGFQRPLLRTTGSTRSLISNRNSIEDIQLPYGDAYNYMEGLLSLNDALTEGMSMSADWSARVAAFNYLKNLLQLGPKGVQEVSQSFEKVMKLFLQHLDDPHHKVAQAALSTLVELVPVCRKVFEAYLERILPHVFSRLVDPKEFIRQLGTSVLDIVGNQYSIDSLLPALLRSLDEQRSPKAKMAVIEFAIAAFAKLAMTGEAPAGSNLLKMWLAKLAPLANDKNAKLKEAAVSGIISVYSHFDSTTVLNFILGLTIEEQSTLRRALKQYTPRIEVELMTFLQNRSQKSRSKFMHDQPDVPSAVDDGYGLSVGRVNSSITKSQSLGGYSSSLNNDGLRKWSTGQAEQLPKYGSRLSSESAEEMHSLYYQSYEASTDPVHEPSLLGMKSNNNVRNGLDENSNKDQVWLDRSQIGRHPSSEATHDFEVLPLPSTQLYPANKHRVITLDRITASDSRQSDGESKAANATQPKEMPPPDDGASSIPSLLNQLSIGSDDKLLDKKHAALHELIRVSKANQSSTWSQYFNQILTGLFEVLDDPDSTVRELALSTVLEMLSNQKDLLEDSLEMLLEKLIHSNRDLVAKVSSAADRCLSVVVTQYDPYRCLSVVVPLLGSEDEKTLITCISCLTKLVGRLLPEDLMAQLPSFLPALFDAFGNQSADVRKTVVFCLVDIYIVLGKAFLPYLGSLSSTQLRLVTIYANRISQARSGTPLDSAPM